METDIWMGERDCPIKCNAACECKNKRRKICVNMCPQCLLQGIPCGIKLKKTDTNNKQNTASNHHKLSKKVPQNKNKYKKRKTLPKKKALPNHINLMEVSSLATKHKKLSTKKAKIKAALSSLENLKQPLKQPVSLTNNQHLPYKTKIAHQTVPIPPVTTTMTNSNNNNNQATVKHLMELQHQIIDEVQKLHPEVAKNDEGLAAMMEVLNTYNPSSPKHVNPSPPTLHSHNSPIKKHTAISRSLDRRLKRIENIMSKITSQQPIMQPSAFASSLPFQQPSSTMSHTMQPCCDGMSTIPPLPAALGGNNPLLQQLHRNLGTHRALVYNQGQLLPQIHPARVNIYDSLVNDLQRLVNWIQARRAANLPPSSAVQTIKGLLDEALLYSVHSN